MDALRALKLKHGHGTTVAVTPCQRPVVAHYAEQHCEGMTRRVKRALYSIPRHVAPSRGHRVTEVVSTGAGSEHQLGLSDAPLITGIHVLLCLQLRGYRVAIVERRRVEGRTQEWNISRGELGVLTRLGLLSPEQLETAIVTEWVRASHMLIINLP